MRIGIGVGLTLPPSLATGVGSALSSLFNGYQGILLDFSKTDRQFDGAPFSLVTRTTDTGGEQLATVLDGSQWGGRIYTQVMAEQPSLVTNGDPMVDDASWDKGGAGGWTISGGVASIVNSSGSTKYLRRNIGITNFKAYEVEVTVDAKSGAGSIVVFVGALNGVTGIVTGAGTFKFISRPTAAADALIYFGAVNGDSVTISKIIVKEIPGNHAAQATSASRPTWRAGGKAEHDGTADNLLSAFTAQAGANSFIARVEVPAAIDAFMVIAGAMGATDERCYFGIDTSGRLCAGVGNADETEIIDHRDLRGQTVVVGLGFDGTTVKLFEEDREVFSIAQDGTPTTTIPFRFGARNNNGTADAFFKTNLLQVVAVRRMINEQQFAAVAEELGGGRNFGGKVISLGSSNIFGGQVHGRGANAASGDWKGLPMAASFAGPGAAAGSGTLEYRASDTSVRWTAPSDTAGPWMPVKAGIMHLDSGTAGYEKRLRLSVKNVSGLPEEDKTVSITVSGDAHIGNRATGVPERIMNMLGWPTLDYQNFGVGGSTSADCVEQVANIPEGPGVAFIDAGIINDISGSVPSETSLANAEAIGEALVAKKYRVIVIGVPARWGVDSSTPMTSGQIAIFDAVQSGLASLAASKGWGWVDSYSVTYDSGNTDRRPIAGMLVDHVHWSAWGAQTIAKKALPVAAAFIGYARRVSDIVNRWAGGFFETSGGTAGTDVTGVVPLTLTVSRLTGSDATAEVSMEPYEVNPDHNWMVMEVEATADSQVIQVSVSASTVDLGDLGLVAGDEFYIAVEYEFTDLVNVSNVDFFTLETNTSPLRGLRANYNGSASDRMDDEKGRMVAGPYTVASGGTHERPYFQIALKANASATFAFTRGRIAKRDEMTDA